ncbi:MAG: MFS transporter [Nitratireductor sp.]
MAAVTGPIAGGLLVDANLFGMEWRPIFLVNIPVGMFAIFAGLRYLPPMPGERELGIDFGGILIAAITMILAVFPLVEGREADGPPGVSGCWRRAFPRPLPLFSGNAVRTASICRSSFQWSCFPTDSSCSGTLVSTAFFSAVQASFSCSPCFCRLVLALTPLESGLTTVPFSFGVLVSSLVAGRFAGKYSRERMIAGAAMLVCAMLGLRWLVSLMGDTVDHWQFLPPLLLGGLGLGTTISPLFQTVLSTVPGRDAGSASGGLQAFQQVGAAIGVATVGQMFFSRLAEGLAAGGNPHPSFIAALEWSLIYTISAFSVVIVAALFLKRPSTGHGGQGQSRPAPAVE